MLQFSMQVWNHSAWDEYLEPINSICPHNMSNKIELKYGLERILHEYVTWHCCCSTTSARSYFSKQCLQILWLKFIDSWLDLFHMSRGHTEPIYVSSLKNVSTDCSCVLKWNLLQPSNIWRSLKELCFKMKCCSLLKKITET